MYEHNNIYITTKDKNKPSLIFVFLLKDEYLQNNIKNDYQTIIDNYYESEHSNHNIGTLYYLLGNNDKALEYYNKSDNSFTLCNIGVLFEDLAEDCCLLYYKKVCDTNSYAANKLGGYYNKKGDNRAEYYYKKSLDLQSDNFLTLNSFGCYHTDKQNYNTSIELFNKSITYGGPAGFYLGLYNLGSLYSTLGKKDLAIHNYLEYIKLDLHKNNDALLSLGYCYCSIKQYDPAIQYYLELLKDGENADCLYALGYCYEKLDNITLAKEYYIRSIDLANHDKARLYLGLIYMDNKEYDHAIRNLSSIVDLDHKTCVVSCNLGYCYHNAASLHQESAPTKLDSYKKAIYYYTISVEKYKCNQAVFCLGNIYYDLGDYEKALTFFLQYDGKHKTECLYNIDLCHKKLNY